MPAGDRDRALVGRPRGEQRRAAGARPAAVVGREPGQVVPHHLVHAGVVAVQDEPCAAHRRHVGRRGRPCGAAEAETVAGRAEVAGGGEGADPGQSQPHDQRLRQGGAGPGAGRGGRPGHDALALAVGDRQHVEARRDGQRLREAEEPEGIGGPGLDVRQRPRCRRHAADEGQILLRLGRAQHERRALPVGEHRAGAQPGQAEALGVVAHVCGRRRLAQVDDAETRSRSVADRIKAVGGAHLGEAVRAEAAGAPATVGPGSPVARTRARREGGLHGGRLHRPGVGAHDLADVRAQPDREMQPGPRGQEAAIPRPSAIAMTMRVVRTNAFLCAGRVRGKGASGSRLIL